MPTVPARFIEPMLLELTSRLPEGPQWLYEPLRGPPHNESYVAQPVMWRKL